MSMNRKVWESLIGFISIGKYPVLPCPYCMSYSLTIESDSISYRKAPCAETSALIAKKAKDELDGLTAIFKKNAFFGVLVGIAKIASNVQREPAKFICFFKCKECGGDVSATGTSQYSIGSTNISSYEGSLLKVEYFSPPIPLFEIDARVPNSIREETLQAFNHFHADICSSGAKLRRSIEKLCVELGYHEKSLHFSLEKMAEKFPTEAKLLHSLKLLGNEATHSDSVNEEDLLDAFEVQEFVLGLFERVEAHRAVESKAKKLLLKFDNTTMRKSLMKPQVP